MDLHIPYTGAMPLRRPGHAKRAGLDQHLALGKEVTELPNSAATNGQHHLAARWFELSRDDHPTSRLGDSQSAERRVRTSTFSRACAWIHVESSAPASEQLLRLAFGKSHLGHVRAGVEQFSVLRLSG